MPAKRRSVCLAAICLVLGILPVALSGPSSAGSAADDAAQPGVVAVGADAAKAPKKRVGSLKTNYPWASPGVQVRLQGKLAKKSASKKIKLMVRVDGKRWNRTGKARLRGGKKYRFAVTLPTGVRRAEYRACVSKRKCSKSVKFPKRESLDVDDWSPRPLGHLLVGGSYGYYYPWERGVFVPRAATFAVVDPAGGLFTVDVDGEDLFPGREVLDEMYTSVGTAASPLVAGLVRTREPGSGVTPESFDTYLVAIDPVSEELLRKTLVLRSPDEDSGQARMIVGSQTSNVATFEYDTPATDKVAAFDVLSAAKIWERNGTIAAPTLTTTDVRQVVGTCVYHYGIENATGRVAFVVDPKTVRSSCQNVRITPYLPSFQGTGVILEGAAEEARYYRFDISVNGESTEFPDRIVDGVTGRSAFLPLDVEAVDPALPFAADFRGNTVDTTTGQVKFALDEPTADALDARTVSLHNGRLYLSTKDGHPVIDLATGRVVVADAAVWPVAAWDSAVLYSDGVVSTWPR